MNWNVPDIFEFPNSSNSSFMYSNDEFAELVWKDGQFDQIIMDDFQPWLEPEMFMNDDEMISWLQYPNMDDCLSDQYLYLTQPLYFDQNDDVCLEFLPFTRMETAATTSMNTVPPPVVLPTIIVEPQPEVNGFGMFSSNAGIFESSPSNSKSVVMELPPVVGSISALAASGGGGLGAMPSGDGGGVVNMMSVEERKRKRKGKGKEKIDSGYQYDTMEVEILESSNTVAKKQVRGSTSSKRNRAATVHNLSEQRRRDRINERMKILQNLIPQSNNKIQKDKATLLDEAIIHLKSLKAQAQIMEGNMVTVVYPCVQQYMPIMGMGMRMGKETNPNPPVMPYPNTYSGSTFPTPVGDGQLAPACYVFPTFHVAPVHNTDPSRIQAINQPNYMEFPQEMQNINQPSFPIGSLEHYQPLLNAQYYQQMQIQMLAALSQAAVNFPNQPAVPQVTYNPHIGNGFGNVDNLDPRNPTMECCRRKRKEEEDKAGEEETKVNQEIQLWILV